MFDYWTQIYTNTNTISLWQICNRAFILAYSSTLFLFHPWLTHLSSFPKLSISTVCLARFCPSPLWTTAQVLTTMNSKDTMQISIPHDIQKFSFAFEKTKPGLVVSQNHKPDLVLARVQVTRSHPSLSIDPQSSLQSVWYWFKQTKMQLNQRLSQ